MLKNLAISLFLVIGLIGWAIIFGGFHAEFFSFGSLGPCWLLVYVLICAAAAWIPPFAGPLDRLLNRLRNPSLKLRTICSIAISVLTIAYLWFSAVSQHRQFFPYIHDEFSYLIQAHQFARCRLWMPAHPLAQFFDSFQLFVKPVYASAYFPGTAMLYVPGIWLHVPAYVTSLIAAGAVAGLLFWITTELLDAVAGALAALLLMSDAVYRQMSLLTLGQLPLMLYGLLAIVAWLRWRSTQRIGWSLAIGLFLGSAAVTRPVDAFCFAIPIGIAVLFRNAKHSIAILIGAVPFLVLQLILNHGITGHWTQTPFGKYADQDNPGTTYGFHPFDPQARPASDLPQKQALFHDEYLPLVINHRPSRIVSELLWTHHRIRLELSLGCPVPFPLLALFLLPSLLGLSKPRAVLMAGMPMLVVLYIPYVFFFSHYTLSVAPGVIIGILVGAKVLSATWKSGRRFAEVGLTMLIAGTAVAAFPQWIGLKDDVFNAPLLEKINQQLAALPHRPAVVLFTYDPARNVHEEPVYNADVA